MSVRKGTVAAAAALAAMVILVYWPVTGFKLVNWDDPSYVSGNPLIQGGVTVRSILQAFTTVRESYWIPLTWLSYMVDVNVHGLAPGGFHLTNLLLHLAAVILCFLALRLMTGAAAPSFGAAALFAVHPLHVESVAWVTERKDVLSGVFFMLVLLAYAWYARKPGQSRLAAVSVLFALGLMAKPMLITLPAVLLLLDWWPLKRFSGPPDAAAGGVNWRSAWPLLREKTPLALLSLACAAVTIWTQRLSLHPVARYPVVARLGNAAAADAGYLVKMAWPAGLAPSRLDTGQTFAWWQITAGLLALTAVTLLAVKARSAPFILVGWLWFAATLLPVSGLFQAGIQRMADRFTYLPLLGIYLAMTAGLGRAVKSRPAFRGAALKASAAVLVILAGASRHQVMFWRDSESLNRRSVEVNPADYDSWSRLGAALAESGRLDEALPILEKAVRLNPSFADGRYNLGLGLLQAGDNSGAIEQFRASLAIQPDRQDALYNLAVACQRAGDAECTVSSYRAFLGLQPGNVPVRMTFGRLLEAVGRTDEAMREFTEVLRLDPGNREAALRIEAIRVSTGRGR